MKLAETVSIVLSPTTNHRCISHWLHIRWFVKMSDSIVPYTVHWPLSCRVYIDLSFVFSIRQILAIFPARQSQSNKSSLKSLKYFFVVKPSRYKFVWRTIAEMKSSKKNCQRNSIYLFVLYLRRVGIINIKIVMFFMVVMVFIKNVQPLKSGVWWRWISLGEDGERKGDSSSELEL